MGIQGMNLRTGNSVLYLFLSLFFLGCSVDEDQGTQRSSSSISNQDSSQENSDAACESNPCTSEDGKNGNPNAAPDSSKETAKDNPADQGFTQIRPISNSINIAQNKDPETPPTQEVLEFNFQLSDWQDYCKLTFNESHSDSSKLPMNINAGDTFLISQMPFTLRSSGGIVASILVPYSDGVILYKLNTQNAQLFSTDCENIEYQYYLVALANTKVYNNNFLEQEICEIEKGAAKVHGGFSTWLHISEKTYSINLDVYSDQCDNPSSDDFYIQANSGLSLSSAQIPIRSLVRPLIEE